MAVVKEMTDQEYEKKYGVSWRLVKKHEGWTDEQFQNEYGTMWEYMKDQDTFARKPREEQALIRSQQAEELARGNNALATIKAYAENEEVLKRFKNFLGDRNARPYMESVVIAVAANPSLQKCSPKSIFIAAARAASLGLSVDPAKKQAHLVPFGNEVTLIPDYHGLVQMSVATGYYEIPPDVEEVYEGQIIEKAEWGGRLTLKGEKVSNTVIGWRAYFKGKDGTERFMYMTNEECYEHAKVYNPGGYASKSSPWNKRPEDRAKMCRKTVLRQLVNRWGNFSPVAKQYLFTDEPILDAETFDMPEVEEISVPEKTVKSPEERQASIEAAMIDLGYKAPPQEVVE